MLPSKNWRMSSNENSQVIKEYKIFEDREKFTVSVTLVIRRGAGVDQ